MRRRTDLGQLVGRFCTLFDRGHSGRNRDSGSFWRCDSDPSSLRSTGAYYHERQNAIGCAHPRPRRACWRQLTFTHSDHPIMKPSAVFSSAPKAIEVAVAGAEEPRLGRLGTTGEPPAAVVAATAVVAVAAAVVDVAAVPAGAAPESSHFPAVRTD